MPEILNCRDLFTNHNQKSLRVSHVVKEGLDYYVLVNEEDKLVKEGKLTSLNQWQGLSNYSGTMTYKNQFFIENREIINKVQLELQEASEIVKVFINGKEAAIKMWARYIFEVSGYVRSGLNTLTIQVTNTLANRICKVSLRSDISGSVKLKIYK